jgi:hypothetical protein
MERGSKLSSRKHTKNEQFEPLDTGGFSKHEFNALAKKGITRLRLSDDAWHELEGTRRQGVRFSLNFIHKSARNARRGGLVLIDVQGEDSSLKLGLIRSIQATSTLESRVVFDLVRSIEPESLDILLDEVKSPTLKTAVRSLRYEAPDFQAISPKLGETILQLIVTNPKNDLSLRQILAAIEKPKRYENALALQTDAIALALKAFGATEGATLLELSGPKTGLANIRLVEDAVIEHDARWIPGWTLNESDVTGRALFFRGDEQLEVFTANKRPLEALFGVDLIYLNLKQRALVMVQYKMLEAAGGRPRSGNLMDPHEDGPNSASWNGSIGEKAWIARVDTQFLEEINRMKKFEKDLSPDGTYRLNAEIFFFKFVRRHSALEAAGILLSLGHLKHLLKRDEMKGPRGGLRLDFESLQGHYLRCDPFVELVRSGYIGSRGATTDHLETLLREVLLRGNGVVAAIHSALR